MLGDIIRTTMATNQLGTCVVLTLHHSAFSTTSSAVHPMSVLILPRTYDVDTNMVDTSCSKRVAKIIYSKRIEAIVSVIN